MYPRSGCRAAKTTLLKTILFPKNLVRPFFEKYLTRLKLGARLRGRTATQRSKKGSEMVLRRVLGKGFSEGF